MKKSANYLIYSIRRNLQAARPDDHSLCAAREGLMTEGIDVTRAKVETQVLRAQGSS